jgi:molybdopterin converting factor small subunit
VATVILPRSLVALFPGAEQRTVVPGSTVLDIVEELELRVPGVRDRLLEPGPAIRAHLHLFVDGERAGLATPVGPASVVHVIAAVSGG